MANDLEMIRHLLQDGETVEKLRLDGWIVLSSQLGPGDEIVILGGRNFSTINRLFDRPVRAIVDCVSSANMVGLELVTEGALSGQHVREAHKHLSGWFDIMWDTYLIVPQQPAVEKVTIVRKEPSDIWSSNSYNIALDKENEWCYFGRLTEDNETGSSQWRVWLKKDWICPTKRT